MQARGEGLISGCVDMGEDVGFWISLRRYSTTEVLNRGLETLVIESNNIWIKRYRDRGADERFIMVATYTKVKNALGMHLRYSQIM